MRYAPETRFVVIRLLAIYVIMTGIGAIPGYVPSERYGGYLTNFRISIRFLKLHKRSRSDAYGLITRQYSGSNVGLYVPGKWGTPTKRYR